jgi:uncharacterized ParB-like nuclease family protein
MRVTDLGLCNGGRRIIAEIRHADDLIVQAEGKQHFRNAGRERYYALRRFGEIQLATRVVQKRPRSDIRHERHTGENALLPSLHS